MYEYTRFGWNSLFVLDVKVKVKWSLSHYVVAMWSEAIMCITIGIPFLFFIFLVKSSISYSSSGTQFRLFFYSLGEDAKGYVLSLVECTSSFL